jgi:hypothetical protein
MIGTAPAQGSQVSALRASVGLSGHPDARQATLEAAEIARGGLAGITVHLALVVTAGFRGLNPVPYVRDVLGPIGVAGGSTSELLTESGPISEGTLVIAMSTEGDAATGAACVSARNLGEAGSGVARLVMAGWPFRLRYPRGLGIAFTGPGVPVAFLESWRQFMGPKMRTVCGVMPGAEVYGSGARSPLASVACLEAAYATGLGHAEGFEDGHAPDRDVLIHGAAEATGMALKRLDDRSAGLVMVLEAASRRRALGGYADNEWGRILSEVGYRAPCVGWVCDCVGGYGRGIQPVDESGSLMVAAVGDPPAVTA